MSKLHNILTSRAIMNNADRIIVEKQIKDLMLDLIGENEPLPTDNEMLEHRVQSRNDLRAVQRQGIQEL